MNAPARTHHNFTGTLVLGALALGFAGLSSCTAVSRGLGKVTANKYANAQSGTVWVVAPPQLEPPAAADRTVYISHRNISDAEIDLTDVLKSAAEAQGWTIVTDPSTARYRLRASTRFFGEVQPETGGADIGNKMGWIAGAAVGIGTGVLVRNATDNSTAGWVAGGAAGGLAGLGVANASKVREWAMITDFVLEEFSEEEVEFELESSTENRGSGAAGTGNSRMNESGNNSISSGSSTSGKRVSNYYPHGVRLSAWANQMNMKEAEAMPEILARTQKVVAQMLPQ